MEIRVYDVEAPLLGDGNEVAEFWLKDRSVLKDTVGNDFAEGKFSGNLNMIEYISDRDKRRAESSGNSMQYTIITMFSVNMILKVIISTSASLMWSLIHVLQVFRYILMINLEMPKLMDILMKYLAIVVGDFEGVQDLVPNLFTEYVVNMTDLSINVTLYSRFENNGYDTPFLAVLFSKQMTILFGTTICLIPIIYIGMKFLKKNSCLYTRFESNWQSFWWNTPLRTFVELYIEISLVFFLNTLNIKFMNTSGVI